VIPGILDVQTGIFAIESVNPSADINLNGSADGDDEALEDSVGIIVVANIDGLYDIPPTPSPVSPAIRKEVNLTVNERSDDYVLLHRSSNNIRSFLSSHGNGYVTPGSTRMSVKNS
jgi:hypothetical protein